MHLQGIHVASICIYYQSGNVQTFICIYYQSGNVQTSICIYYQSGNVQTSICIYYQSGNAQTFASSHFLVTSLCNFDIHQQPCLHHTNV